MDNCIFCKIAAKDIPAQTVYEDDEMLCFKDIRPAAPVHLLLIPKVHFDSLAHAAPEHQTLLGKMMLKVPQIAKAAGLTDGFKTLINTGKGGGQEVFHLHIHIMGTPAQTNISNIHSQLYQGFTMFSLWHWIIVLIIVVLVFGTKKLRNVGKDLGGAVHDFKQGLNEGTDGKKDEVIEHKKDEDKA